MKLGAVGCRHIWRSVGLQVTVFVAFFVLAGCTAEVPNGDGSSGAGAVGGAAGAAGMGGAVGSLPCEVQTVIAARCQNCHAASPIGGGTDGAGNA